MPELHKLNNQYEIGSEQSTSSWPVQGKFFKQKRLPVTNPKPPHSAGVDFILHGNVTCAFKK